MLKVNKKFKRLARITTKVIIRYKYIILTKLLIKIGRKFKFLIQSSSYIYFYYCLDIVDRHTQRSISIKKRFILAENFIST